ncbi:MAG: ATP phosphoribosyltransferase regulatory subunit [Nitrospinota bacterium]
MSRLIKGSRAVIFKEVMQYDYLEQKLLALFNLWGYSRIIIPTIEFLNLVTSSLDDRSNKQVISFFDPSGGNRPLALRSDITSQILKTVALTLANRPLPVRLSYSEPVYRSIAYGKGEKMESRQIGIELIGEQSKDSDAELIILATEALSTLGFEKIIISIGNVEYLTAILSELNLSGDATKEIVKSLRKKNIEEISTLLSQVKLLDTNAGQAILKIASLTGDSSSLTDLPTINQASKKSVDELCKLDSTLKELNLGDKILYDLTEMRGYGYYSGITFEGFVNNIGSSILKGGRYAENANFKHGEIKLQGAGFAIDVEKVLDANLQSCQELEFSNADILLTLEDGSIARQSAIASNLRAKDIKVMLNYQPKSKEELLEYAKESYIKYLLIVGSKFELINVQTRLSQFISESDLDKQLLTNQS